MKEYTVKEVAARLEKHEETIKRWIRSGKLPNSYRNSDKEGWRIVESDLLNLTTPTHLFRKFHQPQVDLNTSGDERELVKLAYEAVTLTSPTDQLLNILSYVGIKRTLEVLLFLQQSPNKVKNPDGFINNAISKGSISSTVPHELSPKVNIDYTRREVMKFPNYDWLRN